VARYPKSESEPLQRGFEIVRAIDEKSRLLDLLFLAEFTQKQHGQLRSYRLKQPDVKEFVSIGIDSGVQPVSFIVDSNHRLVHRDLIRTPVASRL
jgi:hypothetical protein